MRATIAQGWFMFQRQPLRFVLLFIVIPAVSAFHALEWFYHLYTGQWWF